MDSAPRLSLDALLHRSVVLDTAGNIVYIGRLEAHDERGYWLSGADVHDRSEGHATKEQYVNDAHWLDKTGDRPMNRRLVFVALAAVISISALEDVIADGSPPENPGNWMP